MARIAERRERPVRIYRLNGRERYQVGLTQAFNLPDAIHRWYALHEEARGYHDAHFQANTVTLRTRSGTEETYVAAD